MEIHSIIYAAARGSMVAVYLWVALALSGGHTFASERDDHGLGGAFELIDHRGKTVSEADFLGQPALIYFGFSNCGHICPTDLFKIGAVTKTLSTEHDINITPIFVTIDPARDTPEVLAEYVPRFHPDLVGLTGSEDAIEDIAYKYSVYYAPVPMGDSYMMDHSTNIFLIDADGEYLDHYARSVEPQDIVQRVTSSLN